MWRSSVDLPDPDRPRSTVTSFAGKSTVTSSRPRTVGLNRLVTAPKRTGEAAEPVEVMVCLPTQPAAVQASALVSSQTSRMPL